MSLHILFIFNLFLILICIRNDLVYSIIEIINSIQLVLYPNFIFTLTQIFAIPQIFHYPWFI